MDVKEDPTASDSKGEGKENKAEAMLRLSGGEGKQYRPAPSSRKRGYGVELRADARVIEALDDRR